MPNNVGRLPVIARGEGGRLAGMISRSDLLSAHRKRLKELKDEEKSIRFVASVAKM